MKNLKNLFLKKGGWGCHIKRGTCKFTRGISPRGYQNGGQEYERAPGTNDEVGSVFVLRGKRLVSCTHAFPSPPLGENTFSLSYTCRLHNHYPPSPIDTPQIRVSTSEEKTPQRNLHLSGNLSPSHILPLRIGFPSRHFSSLYRTQLLRPSLCRLDFSDRT